MGTGLDMESFRYSKSERSNNDKRKGKRKQFGQPAFNRGPLSLAWFVQAANIPRRNALVVGLVLWYLAGLRSERVGLVLCVERCKPFGLGRKGVELGLRDLEPARLIRVNRGVEKCARVDLLDTNN